MTPAAWGQLALFSGLVLLTTRPLGAYMARVFEGDRRPLPRLFGPVERLLFRLSGVDPSVEQTWVGYAASVLAFSLFSMVVTYAILRLQHVLPLNPQGFGAVDPALAFNTSASFTTNTNWQSYGGESTMSYLSQMAGLAWHNFVSAAAGMGIAIAFARGLTRRRAPDAPRTLGNFWADLIRATVYVLLPLSLVFALLLVSQGVIQNLSAYREVTTVEGAKQVLALGPVASQEAIKELGTNGGGFFNVNSAHPFENPTPFTNLVELWLIFAIPAGLTYTYGRMARDTRQGWAILAAMGFMFLGGTLVTHWAESRPNQALASLSLDHRSGNMEGKEVRFGTAASALFATVTTDASCGAINAQHDSFNPLGGLVPLVNIQLGEIIFGGVGAGLYGMLVFVVLSVFIAGLMVGRTPEYLGKKIESREMKLAMFYVLIFPLIILGFTAWASVSGWGLSSLNNAGPHGLTEMLYAFTSGTGNNGSAFAGLNANTGWWNTLLALAMLGGRFLMIIPVLGIAGSMVGKKVVPAGPGTFPTNGPLFTFLLVSVVLIVGALTFFPALSLGLIVEHFAGVAGKVY
ncbi:MAG TPA: potassium-transporting ATPase subunit KdpA [Myxococcaceae bacterium]|nr:potassium-transporting ATPase subunit KdpA [Myxococcaceae bacterium]